MIRYRTAVMNIRHLYWQCVLLSSCYSFSSGLVHLTVVEKDIELGKSLRLSCEILSDNIQGSRKWFGGKDGGILSLNGVSSNIAKYNEVKLSSSKYHLKIAEVNENDINCSYACRFGFLTDEIFLSVNKSNFKYLPEDDTTHINYVKKSGSYSLQVKLDKVFPVPTCSVKTTSQPRKLTVVNQTINGIFYAVQFWDQSKEPFHICGSPIEIECIIKDSRYTFSHAKSFACSSFNSTVNKNSTGTIILLATGLGIAMLVIVALIAVIVAIFINRNFCRKTYFDVRNDMMLW